MINPGISPGDQAFRVAALINMYLTNPHFTSQHLDRRTLLQDTLSPQQIYFRLCSDHISIEAIPKKQVSLDLGVVKSLRDSRYVTLMWTPHFAVLRTSSGVEVTVRRDGRMIIRNASDEDTAKRVAFEVMTTMMGNDG